MRDVDANSRKMVLVAAGLTKLSIVHEHLLFRRGCPRRVCPVIRGSNYAVGSLPAALGRNSTHRFESKFDLSFLITFVYTNQGDFVCDLNHTIIAFGIVGLSPAKKNGLPFASRYRNRIGLESGLE
ncbi:MAG: hypothetical protein PHT60_11105 [Acidiphilium sp.]|nr:hypothetical protein [Acidiphilium sp.]MDD4936310.1 hypothetical protein [Acidiphilium sp.]